MLAENAADGGANEFTSNGVRALELAFVLELQFSSDGREGGVDVGDAGDHGFFAVASGALLGAADEAFQSRDRQTLADTRAAVDALVLASLKRDFFDDLAEIVRHFDFLAGIAPHPSLLRRDGHSFLDARGIMGANFRADAVFQRRDDFSARRVIFRIRGKNEQDVERKSQRITLDLDVSFLHDVEQTNLNFSGEIGKFIDGENAAVGARQKPVVDGEFVGQIAAAASRADGIHITDNVSHGDVGSSEFFDEAILAGHPGDGSIVAFGGDFFAARSANRFQGIVVDFAAGHDRHLRIEQVDESAKNAALGLAAKAEKNEIVV